MDKSRFDCFLKVPCYCHSCFKNRNSRPLFITKEMAEYYGKSESEEVCAYCKNDIKREVNNHLIKDLSNMVIKYLQSS